MYYINKKKPKSAAECATLLIMPACMTGIAVGGVSAVFAAPAYASTHDTAETTTVRHGDLDLASQHDRNVLDRRIRRAARNVCTQPGIPAMLYREKARICAEAAHNEAWATAQQRIDNIRLVVSRSN